MVKLIVNISLTNVAHSLQLCCHCMYIRVTVPVTKMQSKVSFVEGRFTLTSVYIFPASQELGFMH